MQRRRCDRHDRPLVVLCGLLVSCSAERRPAPPPTELNRALPAAPTATAQVGDAGVSTAPSAPWRSLKPAHVDGLPTGEWTLSYPAQSVLVEKIVPSPKGGFVVAGWESSGVDRRLMILRVAGDGVPRWALGLQATSADVKELTWSNVAMGEQEVANLAIAIGEGGTIGLLARTSHEVKLDGQVVVPDGDHVSLLLIDEEGKLHRALSQEKAESPGYHPPSTQMVWSEGFVTNAVDLIDSKAVPAYGVVVLDKEGRLIRKVAPSIQVRVLAPGRDVAAICKASVLVQNGRRVPTTGRGGSDRMVASLDQSGAYRWSHLFADPVDPAMLDDAHMALAQDTRGHVFVAFRRGNDPMDGHADASVYELDENGGEVHRFRYEPDGWLTHLFPASEGLTVLGQSKVRIMTLGGKKLDLAAGGEMMVDRSPAIFLRAAPDGQPLAIRNLWNIDNKPTIADAAPDGDGYLVVVGTVVGPNSFAGVHVDKGAPNMSFIARIKRP